MICTRVPFTRSQIPFAWGLYGATNFILTLRSSIVPLTMSDVKFDPLLVTILTGHPWRCITCLTKNWAVLGASILATGSALTHLVRLSMATRSFFFFPNVVGNDLTASRLIEWKAWEGRICLYSNLQGWTDSCWQIWQFWWTLWTYN